MPAARSSRTIPHPPGTLWSVLAGQGLRMSKIRNEMNAMRIAAAAVVVEGPMLRKRSGMHIPAVSSATTCDGSFLL